MTHDLRIGWAVSLLFHLLLLLFAVLATLPDIVRRTDFVELQWGTLTSEARDAEPRQPVHQPPVSRPSRSATAPVESKTKGPATTPTKRDIKLPERRLHDLSDDALSIPPRGEKLEARSGGGLPELPNRASAENTRDPLDLRSGGEASGEKALPSTSGAGKGTKGPGEGVVGSDVGFAVQWVGGGTRKRISGKLPAYPEGTQVRAQVQIRAVVAPDGTVRSVTPLRKADRNLEEAAMSELRLWRFEALRSNVAQVDQDCLVTFVFTLR